MSHLMFHHLVTCCVPSFITDSEAALNCVLPNPGNHHWQPQTSRFTGSQHLSPLQSVLVGCLQRQRRGGSGRDIRNRVSQLLFLLLRSRSSSNAAGTTADGCTPDWPREDRGRLSRITYHRHQIFARRKYVPENAYKLRSKGNNNIDGRKRSNQDARSSQRKTDEGQNPTQPRKFVWCRLSSPPRKV